MSKPIIEVKDYSYRYASTEELVLKNITFTVNEGDFVGVVGCNRAGKSTLCKSIVGILPFVSGGDWSGEIVIDGKSLNDTKGNGTTDVVGIVFQDAESQFTQQTVEDEIAFAMCNFGYERNQMRERVKFAAEACGLMGMLDRSPYHLSGGQQQRLCIARALAVEPKVLLMDEPTSALDPISTLKIEELATSLKKDYTIVIVTHNMQQAVRISDYTAFFLLGELVEFGGTEQIFSQPLDKRTEDYITGRFG